MADQSISQLGTATTPLTGDELTVVVQNGVTKQTQLQDIANLGGPAGPVGPQGPTGPTGPGATIQVNSTVTGAPGTNASVTNVGSLQTAMFDFVIPRGDVGATGATGATGPQGEGVAPGGLTGQVLIKASPVDYTTAWADVTGIGTVTSIDVDGGTTGLTFSGGPVTASGVITMAGVLGVANGGTGTTSLTGYVKSSGVSPFTAAATIPTTDLSGTISNIQLANSAITINGNSVSLGGSTTVTATATNALTIGTGLSGTSYDGSSPVTIAISSTGVTAATYGSSTTVPVIVVNSQGQITSASNATITASGLGAITAVNGTANEITSSQVGTVVTLSLPTALTFTGKTVTGGTLTGVSIDGATNTLSNIGNSSLTNSQITLGTTNIALGGTELAPVGLTSVTVTQDPTTNFQLATKQYVDTQVTSGITYHEPVFVESPNSVGNLTATYNNGTSGVGATLTNAGTQVALSVDGVLMTVGKRVLVYNQTNGFENGVYEVTVVGDGSTNWVLTRTADADTYAINSTTALDQGSAFFVTNGDTGAGETYVCNTVGAIVFGTTDITFTQISSTQIYSAGTGLSLAGTQFSIANTAVTSGSYGSASAVGTFTVNAQGQLTLAGNTTIAIANTQVSGLGTMSTQNANNVAITGGNIDGTIIGAATAAAITGTTITATNYVGISGGTF